MGNRALAVALGLVLVGGRLDAQTTDGTFAQTLSRSMASVTKAMHATIRRNIAEAAESMPASDYSFKPTPQVRSFAELVGHLANANVFFCAQSRGAPARSQTNHEELRDKAALVKAITQALAYCDTVYEAISDTNFGAAVTLPGPQAATQCLRRCRTPVTLLH